MREIYFILEDKEMETLSRLAGKSSEDMSSSELASTLHQLLELAYQEPERSFEVECTEDISVKGVQYWSKGKKYLVFTRDFDEFTAESDTGEGYLSGELLADNFMITDIDSDVLEAALTKAEDDALLVFKKMQK